MRTDADYQKQVEELKAEVRKVLTEDQITSIRECYYIPGEFEEALPALDAAAQSLDSPYDAILKAFVSNVYGTAGALGMPYSLAHSASVHRIEQRVVSSERIRALGRLDAHYIDVPQEQLQDEAEKHAASRMRKIVRSDDGQRTITIGAFKFLATMHEIWRFKPTTTHLINQSVVTAWTAVEVLLRDMLQAILNTDKTAAAVFLGDLKARKRFNLDKINADTLLEYGLDISQQIGTMAMKLGGTIDLPALKQSYDVILPQAAGLRDALNDDDVWLLYQCRHLISHRGGIIDQDFLSKCSFPGSLGEKIELVPDDVSRLIAKAITVGSELSDALNSRT